MPTPEELRAMLAILEQEEGDDDTGSELPKPASESSNLKAVRDHAKKLERQNKAFEKELEELRQFREQATSEKRAAALRDAGLTEGQAKAFVKVYDDVTPENLTSFKVDVLGVREQQQADPEGGTAPSFLPTATGPVEPSDTKMSRKDFEQLWKTNEAKAREVMRRNGVKWDRETDAGIIPGV